MKYKGIIYRWYNTVSKKSYIGQTRDIKNRMKSFLNINEEYTKWGSKIDNARKKYGVRNNIWERSVLFSYSTDKLEELCSILNEKEIYYITKYDSYNNGYNSTLGGDGSLLTEEMRIKLKERGKEQWDDLSDKEKEEHRIFAIKNFEEIKKDEKRYNEWLEKLKDSHFFSESLYKLNRTTHIGKSHSKETKDRIRESTLKNDNGKKSVQCLDMDGNIKQIFASLSEVEQYGYKPKGVSSVLHGWQKTHRGLFWEFVNKENCNEKECKHAVYIPRLNRYRSRISVNGKQYTLGHYEKAEDASKIYFLALEAKCNGTFEEWYNTIETYKLQFK